MTGSDERFRFDPEIVVNVFGWRLRLYAGHTVHRPRFRWWRTDLSRGLYVRPYGSRVVGLQWRRT